MSNADAVEEKNGRAYIYYKKLKENDTTYLAGRFNSKGKFATTYGFLECRMHIVYPEGYQMAFWMMPAQEGGTTPGGIKDGTARDGAEIDIIEGNRQSDSYSCGLHWDGYGDAHQSNGEQVNASALHDQDFHVFGLEWSADYLKFYYDGKLTRTLDQPGLIPQVPHFLYFSGHCFGENTWVDGDVRSNTFIQNGGTAESYIDYARVYKRI